MVNSEVSITENQIASVVVDAALHVHKEIGPGLLESAYESCLAYELQERGLLVERQIPLPLIYKNIKIDCGYRLDILVEKKVIVEIKSIDAVAPVHKKQLMTYLRLSDIRLGLLINFNVSLIKDGITRIVNHLEE